MKLQSDLPFVRFGKEGNEINISYKKLDCKLSMGLFWFEFLLSQVWVTPCLDVSAGCVSHTLRGDITLDIACGQIAQELIHFSILPIISIICSTK